jgi:protein-L-isoaspartate(D-aspartate) O-methyltransferase
MECKDAYSTCRGIMSEYTSQKKKLLDRLERSGYIGKPSVRAAMEAVPREAFLPDDQLAYAYDDRPLSIGSGQTISAPHMNAMMCTALDLPAEKPILLLEIGTGSGYHAVLCAEMLKDNPGSHVYTVERVPELAEKAKAAIESIGYGDMITVVLSDGTLGLPDYAPYDRIMVTAAAPRIPPLLAKQLKEGGILLIPVGERGGYQRLIKAVKEKGHLKESEISGVAFVPLIGQDGFSSD